MNLFYCILRFCLFCSCWDPCLCTWRRNPKPPQYPFSSPIERSFSRAWRSAHFLLTGPHGQRHPSTGHHLSARWIVRSVLCSVLTLKLTGKHTESTQAATPGDRTYNLLAVWWHRPDMINNVNYVYLGCTIYSTHDARWFTIWVILNTF